MTPDSDFRQRLDALVASSALVVDRPRGSPHPRYPSFIYPLDYGYLAGTSAADSGGIDVWIGSQPERRVTAIICNVDLLKRETEVKLLVGCAPEEAEVVRGTHNRGEQSAILIMRPLA